MERADRPRWSELVLFLLGGLALYAVFHQRAYDDPFITFRYAHNLRHGLGLVYNPGERVLSTTAPLYAILLGVLGHLWESLPHLSNLISALSLALGGLWLWRTGRRWETPVVGIVAGVLLPSFPLMVATLGAETCFYVMSCLGAFALYAGGRYHAALAVAAMATLTRSDGVLVAVVLGAVLIAERGPRSALKPLALFAVLIAPWYLFSWAYFGSPFPVTLTAKQHQGQMMISSSFAHGFVELLRGYGGNPFYWLHGALAVLGVVYGAAKGSRWFLIVAWSVLYFVAYTLLGVSRYFWYYAPLVPAVLIAVGLGVAAAKQWLPRALTEGARGAVCLIILFSLLLWPQARGLWSLSQHPDQRVAIYREVGKWLNRNTPSGASVATLEVGIIGYYARRRMIGFAGLIQPAVAKRIGRETTYEDTARWAVEHYHPDYLVLGDDWFAPLVRDVVPDPCVSAQEFSSEDYEGKLIVYECDWSS